MKKTIQSFKRLFHGLKNDEHYKLHYGMINNLGGHIGVLPALDKSWIDYRAAFHKEDMAYKLSIYSSDSKELQDLDLKRDNGFLALKQMIAGASRSLVDEQKAAGMALDKVMHKYRSAAGLAYVEETSQIINCIQDLRLTENRAYVDLLKLGQLIDDLEAVNTEFEDVYNRRSLEWGSDRKMGNLFELRQATDDCFGELAGTTEVLYLSSRIPPENTAQETLSGDMIDIINALLEQAKDVYYRRVEATKPQSSDYGTDASTIASGKIYYMQVDTCEDDGNYKMNITDIDPSLFNAIFEKQTLTGALLYPEQKDWINGESPVFTFGDYLRNDEGLLSGLSINSSRKMFLPLPDPTGVSGILVLDGKIIVRFDRIVVPPFLD